MEHLKMISQDVSRVSDILKEILVPSFISVHKPHFCSFDLTKERHTFAFPCRERAPSAECSRCLEGAGASSSRMFTRYRLGGWSEKESSNLENCSPDRLAHPTPPLLFMFLEIGNMSLLYILPLIPPVILYYVFVPPFTNSSLATASRNGASFYHACLYIPHRMKIAFPGCALAWYVRGKIPTTLASGKLLNRSANSGEWKLTLWFQLCSIFYIECNKMKIDFSHFRKYNSIASNV